MKLSDMRTSLRGAELTAEIARLEAIHAKYSLDCLWMSRLRDLRSDVVRLAAPAGARFALVVWGVGLASDSSELFPSPEAAAAKVAELKEIRWKNWDRDEQGKLALLERPIPKIYVSMDRADGQPGSECTTFAPKYGGGWVEDHYRTTGETFG